MGASLRCSSSIRRGRALAAGALVAALAALAPAPAVRFSSSSSAAVRAFPAEQASPATQEGELVPPPFRQRAQDPHVEELLRLMSRIERNLRAIDGLLVDASSGSPDGDASRPVGALVGETTERGCAVLDDIDAILELVCDCEPGGS